MNLLLSTISKPKAQHTTPYYFLSLSYMYMNGKGVTREYPATPLLCGPTQRTRHSHTGMYDE